MTMMNVIGNIVDVDSVLHSMMLTNKVDLVSAISQIEDNSFLFNVKDENIEKLIDLNDITSFKRDNTFDELLKIGEEIKTILNLSDNEYTYQNSEDIDKLKMGEELKLIYEEVKVTSDGIDKANDQLLKIERFYKHFQYTNELLVPIEDLRGLQYFNYKLGALSKENRIKLKNNYENILAIFFHTGTSSDGDTYLVIYPSSLNEEISRILRSLSFREIIIDEDYKGTLSQIKENMQIEKIEIEKRIEEYQRNLIELKDKYNLRMLFLLDQIRLNVKLETVKEKLTRSNRFFYLSGWVAESDKSEIETMLKKYKDMLIIFKSHKSLNPPTRLKNNWLFKPFESLVRMYGMPSYNEIDPTPFLSLSYMLLFGVMFGDLGQGLILFLAGIFLSKKIKVYGGLLSRLGISSMIFGGLYGSVFGFEDILPAILIKPFENINKVLIAAIAIGIVLILISYIFGIINSLRRKDIEEGIFGKEGLVGFVFYLSLLVIVGGRLIDKTLLPVGISIVLIILCLLGLVFKQPLAHLVEGKRPLHGKDISGYYIESVFSLLETLLSMLSGTISFIRVGAFALTHVGLFIAFQTIAKMIGNPTANIVVLVIGNIVIIGLEGLIVLIQGLRLQYYELFSRYYKGEGKEFNPINLKDK